MQIDLTGKNVLITGGTRGIGRAIALTLARSGARIGAIYRSDHAAAQRTRTNLLALNTGEPEIVQADISDEGAATDAVRQIAGAFGDALDVVILDAAAGSNGPLVAQSPDDWKRNFEVNVYGAFYVVRACAPFLRPNASVIFLSSGAGHDPLENLSGYGASKAAVNQMAFVLAQEMGPQAVRVNVVSPGSTYTGEDDPNRSPDTYTDRQRETAEATALRRIGIAQDVANVVLFFASDLSGFVTGQWLRVNGGRV